MSEHTIDANRHHFTRTLPFGAQMIGAERARFRLWAPSRDTVALEIDGQPARAMTAGAGGWFEIETDCQPGARYQYRFDESLVVPDPASRFQPDDVHGPSVVVDPTSYHWQHPEWHGLPWEETVLYELHAGACGGYRGVMEKLPALRALGVTAVELMPLNDFPGARNWGYDGVLPFAPDATYGSPDELKALIDTAHGLGMMVFLDVVYNHFGPDGNYLHAYAEPFFKAGTHTPWGPAIDFDRPEVRDFFFENALYWLMEYRFDGLRLDAVHAIDNDGWLRELSERVQSSVEDGRHVHLVLENERNTSSLLVQHFQAQWSDDAHNTMHVLLTGETESYYEAFAEQPLHKLARVLGEGFVYQGQASPIHDGETRGEPSASLPPTAFVFFLQNHDQVGNRAFGERLRLLTNDDALRAATALMLLSPQIPMLFMGEENGAREPFFFFTGYSGELADAVREGRRKEFAKFAAFNDEARREEIPDPNAESTFERSRPRFVPADAVAQATGTPTDDDAQAWLAFYRDALAVRHQHVIPGLHGGAQPLGAEVFAASDADPRAGAIIARWRLGTGAILTIAVNLSADDVAAPAVLATPIYQVPAQAGAALAAGRVAAHSCVVTLEKLAGDAARTTEPPQ
ncbi:malto-oligosyltrehalose trehalohydrolase [Robbsia sp. Bb-Pol-6]|uniref:Malto-oligosyltrehalose trehalohydrolase n=1 Tax=Robbsia betulipollinis TaxID=2981849 RepID=A0ABT3ZIS3_9BURK|nr:malto-oligosyltrehalose trehalohydrolase [Robbsia betulipollinis]MCY0386434.1 malto-oligosyltrehalose trehalohydrolase [Robbsia betulipollinis]